MDAYVSLLFAHSFPVTPKSFPVNFDNEFRLKPRMAAAFAGDAIVNLRPNFRFSLYFSLLFRNFESLETGSSPTASSATQSDPIPDFSSAFFLS
jgi:hypothetical protein